MKKLIVVLFLVFLTGCELLTTESTELNRITSQSTIRPIIENTNVTNNDDGLFEALKSQLYNELKIELANELKVSIRNELYQTIYNELKTDLTQTLTSDLSLLIDEKLNQTSLDLNKRIDEIIANQQNVDYDTLKQELQLYITGVMNDLSLSMKQEIVNEINLNNSTNVDVVNLESMIINVVNKNTKGVLGVSNYQMVNNRLQQVSTGSGVIYKKVDNVYYLVTNEHVVRDAKKLSVVLENNQYIDATLIGSHLQTDLAVLKFTSSLELPVSTFADSNLVTRGQIAIAIGSPLGYQYYGSVTMGVISGLNRNVNVDYNEDGIVDFTEVLIQHDVAINPGNSGGPLYNINGEIIGINNMKSIETNVDNIGFAIPSNKVIEIINLLVK